MPKHAWFVRGFDELNIIFRAKLSASLSEKEIAALLQRLAARHLTANEVVTASLRRTHKGHRPLLEVRRESGARAVLSVGENPHYVASVHVEAEFADMEP